MPQEFSEFNKLGLCTGVDIGRLEVANSLAIGSLEFLGNVTVSRHAGSFPDSIIPDSIIPVYSIMILYQRRSDIKNQIFELVNESLLVVVL